MLKSTCCRHGVIFICTLGLAFTGTQAQVTEKKSDILQSIDTAEKHLRLNQPRDALHVLDTIERNEPHNPWLWYFRGAAYTQLHDPHRAVDMFDTGLQKLHDLGDPDPTLDRLIRQARRDVRREYFFLSWQFGLAHDSNATFEGGGQTGDFVSGKADEVAATTLLLEYAPFITATEKFTIGARAGGSRHFRINEFDYQQYGGYFRYDRHVTDDWQLSLLYNYDIDYLERESFLSNHSFSPSLTYYWPKQNNQLRPTETLFEYRIELRDFLFDIDPLLDRDGIAHAAAITQKFSFAMADPSKSGSLTLGYQFTSIATQGTEFDRLTHDFLIGMEFPLLNSHDPTKYLLIPDKKLSAHIKAQWHIADYREASIIDRDGDERHDFITAAGVVLSQLLIDDPDDGELLLHLIFNWSDTKSNVRTADRSTPFTYDKIVAGLQVQWRF